MATLQAVIRPLTKELVSKHFDSLPSGSTVDLYDSMNLFVECVVDHFFFQPSAGLASDEDVEEIRILQEELLHGQFSLLPVALKQRCALAKVERLGSQQKAAVPIRISSDTRS